MSAPQKRCGVLLIILLAVMGFLSSCTHEATDYQLPTVSERY